jgi:DNA-binding FrmR family transcriptional regulator
MTSPVRLAEKDRRAVRNRLSRARGQLDAVIRQLEENKDCLDVLPQMIAASKAVDRATYAMVLSAIESCSSEPGDHPDIAELKKLFLSLA